MGLLMFPRTMFRAMTPIIIIFTLCIFHPQTAPVSALEDGRIGVLYVGCIARSRPFWDMRSDLLFSINFVQATLRDWAGWGPVQQASEGPQVYRMVRLYMPRTYNHLVENFDIIVLANANRFAVGPKYTEMLARGVREGGMSLLMSGGWESFGGSFGRPEWGETAIGRLLPTEDVIDTWIQYPSGGFQLVIDRHDHEFISSLPWEPGQRFMREFHHNLVKVKLGADVLAHVDSATFRDHPAFVTWDLSNETRSFAMTGEIHTLCWWGDPWEYAIDFGANPMIYLDRRPVP